MSSKKVYLFDALFNVYKETYPEKKLKECQIEVVEIWNRAKASCPDGEFEGEINSIIASYQLHFLKRRVSDGNDACKGAKQLKRNESDTVLETSSDVDQAKDTHEVEVEPELDDASRFVVTDYAPSYSGESESNPDESSNPDEGSSSSKPRRRRQYDKPAQKLIEMNINALEENLRVLMEERDAGTADKTIHKKIQKVLNQIEDEKKNIKKTQGRAERQKKYRDKVKAALQQVCEKYPDVSKQLKMHSKAGRPRHEENEPELLNFMIDLAMIMTADKRKDKTLRASRNFSQLQELINSVGFEIFRCPKYLRILYQNVSRRLGTFPVKLCQPIEYHGDSLFCEEITNSLEILASILGPEQVAFVSHNTKARVAIGSKGKKSPFLMRLEYKNKFDSHDWLNTQKFIPSVYAGMIIKSNNMGNSEAVTNSGPTYIAIENGRNTRAIDLGKIMDLDIFVDILKTVEGDMKPVLLLSVDGGPKGSPRYRNVVAGAVQTFKDFNLDAMFVFSEAPGSADCRVERRLAPLSHVLSGLVIPYKNLVPRVVDDETTEGKVEIQNFEFAGNVLADLWSEYVIDDFSVFAEYIASSSDTEAPELPSPDWYAEHVQESQYLLQIVKCQNRECCRPHRSGLRQILLSGFLTPPFPIKQSSSTLELPQASDKASFAPFLLRTSIKLPTLIFDQYCPSVQTQLKDRTCENCSKYYTRRKSLQDHYKEVHSKKASVKRVKPFRVILKTDKEVLCVLKNSDGTELVEWIDENDVDLAGLDSEEETKCDSVVSITYIEQWLKPIWMEDLG